MVHSKDGLATAVEASEILFDKGTADTLKKLDEATFLSVFEGVPMVHISKDSLQGSGVNIIDLLGEITDIFPSKGEARRMIKGGGLSINKEKVEDESLNIGNQHLIKDSYILVQKGKKNYHLITCK